jgi:hypothetical protein
MTSGYTEPIGGTTSEPSTTRFGNKPIRAVMKLLSGVELDTAPSYGSTYIPFIKTPFDIRHSKLRLRDDDGSHYTDFLMSALAANQRLRIPVLENEESSAKVDDVMILKQTQSMLKKTIPISGSNPNIIHDLTATEANIASFDAGGTLIKSQLTAAHIPDGLITAAKLAAFTQITLDRVAVAPADPAANKSILYVKQIDANNDGIFYKIKKNGAYVEGQLL